MSGFSTIGGGSSSAQQVNFSISANASQTVSALYIANGIVDVAGLLVSIYNNGASAITLTAASGSIVNTASWTAISTSTTVTIQPNQTLILETNLANLNYFINDYSQIGTVWGGAAGQLLWQSAPNTTGFIPTGTANYILQCNGTSIPTWVPNAVPNVQGGAAGEILYQTATNATGFVAPGTAGQYLTSNGTGAPTWTTFAAGQGVKLTVGAGTATLQAARTYEFNANSMVSGQSFVTFLSNAGIPDQDGNQYTIYNNTSSVFTLILPVINNYESWSYQGNYFIQGSSLYLQVNESVNIQTYSAASSIYTVMDTSQSQSWGFNAQITSEGNLPAGSDTLMNFVATADNTGGFNNTTHAYVIPKKGIWFFSAQTGFNSSSTAYSSNIQIRQNNNQSIIAFYNNSSATSSNNITMRCSVALACNVGDQITVTNYITVSSPIVNLGSATSFNGVLCK
jgi:hypothetical protein